MHYYSLIHIGQCIHMDFTNLKMKKSFEITITLMYQKQFPLTYEH
jgi:hypothetical protein